MWEALKICAPITLMTFAIFTRPNMVVNPGWLQIADTLLVLIGTCGITFAMFGRCHPRRRPSTLLTALPAGGGVVPVHVPSRHDDVRPRWPWWCWRRLVFGIWRHRQIAPPKSVGRRRAGSGATAGDLAPVLAEAKRDIG